MYCVHQHERRRVLAHRVRFKRVAVEESYDVAKRFHDACASVLVLRMTAQRQDCTAHGRLLLQKGDRQTANAAAAEAQAA